MHPLVLFVSGGGAFLTGIALVVTAILIRARGTGRPAFWAIAGGLVAIAVSATPVPPWMLGVAIAAIGVGMWPRRFAPRERIATLVGGTMIAALGLAEVRHLWPPVLRPCAERRVAIVGDSIAAGHGDGDRTTTWPRILRERHGVDVADLSVAGATVGSATRLLDERPVDAPVVVLEIGGNDLLSGTPPASFEAGLDALLAALRRPGRQVVMFELPLPPLHERYGRIQRTLASRYGVSLIPRWALLSVITTPGATVDSIHLTQRGHDAMAAIVWSVLGPALPEEAPQARRERRSSAARRVLERSIATVSGPTPPGTGEIQPATPDTP